MQSIANISHALYRITFRRGSPQRLHYSQPLTGLALVAFVLLAVATQVYVFERDVIDVILYLFASMCGMYLGLAWLSRKAPASRLRTSLQAAAIVLAAAHAILLLFAPLTAAVPGLRYLATVVAAVIVVLGFTNCVHYALGGSRARSVAFTWAFAFAVACFYATMQWLATVAMA